MFSVRFFYNDGSQEGGGGAAADVVVAPDAKVELPIEIQEQLKELQDLREYKKSITEREPDKTPEEIAKASEIEKAELLKFSAENDLMKVDDFAKYESLKARADRDLVFEGYVAQWKEENPEITDEAEIEAQSKADFENEYKLNSDNEKSKARGVAKLAKDAADLRSPLKIHIKLLKKGFPKPKT